LSSRDDQNYLESDLLRPLAATPRARKLPSIRALAALPCLLALSVIASSQTPHKPAAPSSKPPADEQLYRNSTFAFRYKIPYGWVDRTEEMREDQSAPQPDAKPETGAAIKSDAQNHSTSVGVLLAIFERPPNAPGDSVNSAAVIVSENAAVYPGLKKADDYLAPLTELVTAKGFKSAGDPSIVDIDSRELVRADFSKPLTDKLTMHQSTLVLLAKSQIVSFTFIAGSEDDLDQLIENLHFAATKSGAAPTTKK
jgi:hypothetical protein